MREAERIPSDCEVDHHDPERFVLRCPDCGQTRTKHRRPGPNTRACERCSRLMGVTPISTVEDADESLDAEGQTQSTFKCDICDQEFDDYQALGGHKSQHAMTDGGRRTEWGAAAGAAERAPDRHHMTESTGSDEGELATDGGYVRTADERLRNQRQADREVAAVKANRRQAEALEAIEGFLRRITLAVEGMEDDR